LLRNRFGSTSGQNEGKQSRSNAVRSLVLVKPTQTSAYSHERDGAFGIELNLNAIKVNGSAGLRMVEEEAEVKWFKIGS
jgi:hypothetical protein